MNDTPDRHLKGNRFSRMFNEPVAVLTRMGLPIAGSRVLRVRGRVSGQWRTTPVNPLGHDGDTYLVAPRGHTQWVRNMRAVGGGELQRGRHREAFTAEEIADADKPEILRAYLRRWRWESGMFFEGLTADAPDSELLRVAPGYPVFRIHISE